MQSVADFHPAILPPCIDLKMLTPINHFVTALSQQSISNPWVQCKHCWLPGKDDWSGKAMYRLPRAFTVNKGSASQLKKEKSFKGLH